MDEENLSHLKGSEKEGEVELLDIQEIVFDDYLVMEGVKFSLNSTAIVYLKEKRMYILSQEPGSITDIIGLMKEGNLIFNLASENLAVLPYTPPAEPLPEESAEDTGDNL